MDFQLPQGLPTGTAYGSGFGSRGQLSKNPTAPGGATGSPTGTAQNSSAPTSPFQAPNPIEDPTAPGGAGSSMPTLPSQAHASAPPAWGAGGRPGNDPNWAFNPHMWAGSGQPNPQDIGKSFGSEIFQPLANGPHASIPPPGGAPSPPPGRGGSSGPSSLGDFMGRTLGGLVGGFGFSSPFQAIGGANVKG